MAKSTVTVLKTNSDSILPDYIRLLELSNVEQALPKTNEVILKDNISWHFPAPAANTTPWQLEGTILGMKKLGYNKLSCVQNKTVVTNVFKGEDLNKYKPVLAKYNVPILYNFKKEDMNWITYTPKFKTLVLHKIFPEGIKIPDYFFNKSILHLPTIKCHIYTTTTGAMKNAFGGLLNTRRHYTHSWIHETLVDLLAIQKEIHSGIFAVMDGTTAGNGPGPRTMKPEIKNVILASSDQVAIDAVSAKMMGFDPMKIKYIRLATEKGLGTGRMQDIDIIGEDISNTNWHFKVGINLVRFGGSKIFWHGPLKGIQNLFFRTPLVHLFILASEIYHDFYRWPFIDKKIFKKWLKNTEWGGLFQKYQ